jgi:hypothetical protein
MREAPMSTAMIPAPPDQLSAELIESVVVRGDLAKLTPTDRMKYYQAVCESLGLNPLTRPFEYLTLQGRMILYARRECTEQLRKIHGVSMRIVSREIIDDCYVVTARATDRAGREDESTGVVMLEGLKGIDKANGLMKCETKAKRRATLSLCGLAFLDESELDTVPAAKPEPVYEPEQGTRAAQVAVAERKIAELQAEPKPVIEFPPASSAWQTRGQMKNVFAKLREIVGEVEYGKELERAGVNDASEFRYLNAARECYSRLVAIAQQEVA